MIKHQYEISINEHYRREVFTYDFGNIKNILISVGKQKASIIIESGALREAKDILSFRYRDFRDAFRKALLLHIVKYSRGLNVRKIIVKIDGQSYLYDKNNDPIGHFPYMFSMIGNSDIALCPSWEALSETIVRTTKTSAESDLRFACFYSFLASRTKEFFVDRFANLWTAMNAYYSYIATKYEEKLKKDHNITTLSGKLKVVARDTESIGLASWLLYPKYTDISDRDRLKELWRDNFQVESLLKSYSISDAEELYNACKKDLYGEPLPSKYDALAKCAETFNVKLYTFLLLVYPYNLRCKYFHGNSPTILIAAYNDYEIGVLETVNYFISTFLNDCIPELFMENFWTEDKQRQAENYIEYISGKRIDYLIEKCQKQQRV